MQKVLVAPAAALSLAGPVFAQGLPAGVSPPQYGSHAFPDAQYENGSVFSKLFGHVEDSNQAPADTNQAPADAAEAGQTRS